MGIVSLVVNLLFVPGILAIIWGGRERNENSKARTGFICGIIGTALSAAAALFLVLFLVAAGNAVDTAVSDFSDFPAFDAPAFDAPAFDAPAFDADPDASDPRAVARDACYTLTSGSGYQGVLQAQTSDEAVSSIVEGWRQGYGNGPEPEAAAEGCEAGVRQAWIEAQ